MISRERLERAVHEALSLLKSVEDVREAEVFAASNQHLLTRLHYTSHLPCNGAEEPKSTLAYGIGIRAVFRTPTGVQIGFGSEPSDLTAEGVRQASKSDSGASRVISRLRGCGRPSRRHDSRWSRTPNSSRCLNPREKRERSRATMTPGS